MRLVGLTILKAAVIGGVVVASFPSPGGADCGSPCNGEAYLAMDIAARNDFVVDRMDFADLLRKSSETACFSERSSAAVVLAFDAYIKGHENRRQMNAANAFSYAFSGCDLDWPDSAATRTAEREIGLDAVVRAGLDDAGDGSSEHRLPSPFPPQIDIDLRYGKYGNLEIWSLPPYSLGARRIIEFRAETFSGRHSLASNRPLPLLSAVMPRDDAVPLGTLFRKHAKGFGADIDELPASSVDDDVIRNQISYATFTALVLKQTLETLLDDDAAALRKLESVLRDGRYDGLTSIAMGIVAEDIYFNFLPADVTDGLIEELKVSSPDRDRVFYFVADAEVYAKRVAYYVTPEIVDEHFDPVRFNAAVAASDGVSKRDDVFVIAKTWKNHKLVGLGLSPLGLTKLGSIRLDIAVQPAVPDAVLALSRKTPGILSGTAQ